MSYSKTSFDQAKEWIDNNIKTTPNVDLMKVSVSLAELLEKVWNQGLDDATNWQKLIMCRDQMKRKEST